MGNSIEEDIKTLRESIIEEKYYIFNKDLKRAIENLLSAYKRVLKENEELKNKLLDTLEGQKVIKEETPQYIKENYISKEKVKDKIETLEKIQKEFPNNERLEVKIIAYKELLEKEQ